MTTQEDVATTLGLDHAGAGRPRWRRWLWIAGAVIVLVGAFIFAMGTRKANGIRYVTQPAKRGDLVVTVSATGTLQPIKKVEVGIEVSGTIQTVEVDYNSQVTNGQVLARLDISKLEAQALQSAASLESACATVQEAEAQVARFNRVHELSGGKMPSQSDLDTATAALARAKAAVTQWEATLAVNRTDIAKAVVRSPINGVVLTRSIEPGQTVAAALTTPVLFTLAEDLTKMELQVDVDEADVGQVQAGQSATFTVDAYPDRAFPARITQVRYGSQTVEGVVTYKTVLTVDNSDLLLRPGMTATAVITVQKRDNVLLIPNAALRFAPPQSEPTGKATGGGGLLTAILPRPPQSQSTPRDNTNNKGREQTVWILRNGQLTPVAITKGVTDGTMTEVTGGTVEPGTELVTDMIAAK